MKKSIINPSTALFYFFCGIFLCLTNVSIYAQNIQNTNGWYPNGVVQTTAEDDTHIYLGGDFSHMIKHGTNGMISNGAVLQTSNNANLVPGYPMIDVGNEVGIGVGVRCVIPDGTGGWFVAGKFQHINGVLRPNLIRIKADKTWDTSWNPNPVTSTAAYSINTLLLNGNDLYVGGGFENFGGFNIKNLAKINATTGQVDSNWQPNPNNQVGALVIASDSLLVGGGFTEIGGHNIRCLAKVATTGSGAVNTFWKPYTSPTVINFIHNMVVLNNHVFIAGSFVNGTGFTVARLSKINMATGIVDATWNPQPNGMVWALAASANHIYVGGNFTYFNGYNSPFARIARINVWNGLLDSSWKPRISGYVNSLLLQGSDLYVAGNFKGIQIGESVSDFKDIPRSHIARLKTNFLALDNTWKPAISDKGEILAMSLQGGNLFVGGNFISAGGLAHKNLARIRKSDMELDVLWKPEPDGWVSTLLRDKQYLYVGGRFQSILNTNVPGLMRFSLVGSSAVDEAWKPINTPNMWVNSLAVRDSSLFVAGNFQQIGGKMRRKLAKISTNNAGNADPSWTCDIDANGTVNKILLLENSLYVGGKFDMIGNLNKKNLAKVDVHTGIANPIWTPNPNNEVRSMTSFGKDLYVSGIFNIISNSSRKSIARFNESGFLHSWSPTEVWTGGDINFSGTDLYVLGTFIGNKKGICRFTSMNVFDGSWHLPLTDGAKYTTIAPVGAESGPYAGGRYFQISSKAIVGGYFNRANQQSVSNFVVFEPSFVPEIEVLGNSINIPNYDNTPYQEDGTDLGYAIPNTSTSRTYTIRNIGTNVLQITSISCTNSTDFSVSGLVFPLQIAAGSSATFLVQVNAPSVGVKTGKIVINNNDADESAFEYDIRVQVNLTYPPEIALRSNNHDINHNASAISLLNNTNFGETVVGNPKTYTYIIKNTGAGALDIASIASSSPQDFAVAGITLPTSIQAGDSTTFTITQMLTAPYLRHAIITIQNNDIDEGNYVFRVGGITVAPKMQIINVPNGTNTPTTENGLDMGITILGHPITKMFSLTNTAIGSNYEPLTPLVVSSFTIDNTTDFEVQYSAPQNQTSLGGVTVIFKANSTGIKKAKISLYSNDLVDNPYTFTVQASANIWKPMGTIYAMEEDAQHIYLASDRIRWYKKGTVGIYGVSEVMPFSENGTPLTMSIPTVEGDEGVRSIVSDGAGGWFIGGNFTKVGGVSRSHIAHIKADYTLDLNWNPPVMAPVRHLVFFNGYLYANASFGTGTDQNNIAANVARIVASTGLLDTTWQPDPNGTVHDIQINANHVYLYGSFSTVGGLSINNLARVSFAGVTDNVWKPNVDYTTFASSSQTIPSAIIALGADGIFIRENDGFLRKYHLTGTGLLTGWIFNWQTLTAPVSGYNVKTLLAVGNYLFVGGEFTKTLVRLPANGTSTVTIDPTWDFTALFGRETRHIRVVGNDMYVCAGTSNGSYVFKVAINGNGTISNSWQPTVWYNNPYVADEVKAVASDGNVMCVIRAQPGICGGLLMGSLVRIKKADMELDLSWNPQVSADYGLSTLALSQNEVFIGGGIYSINGISFPTASVSVAKISKSNGVYDQNWKPTLGLASSFYGFGSSKKLVLVNNDLYITGNFDKVNGISRNGIAKVSSEGIGELDVNWNPNVVFATSSPNLGYPNANDPIDVLSQGDSLFIFGNFTTVGGQARNGGAKISRLGTGACDPTWNPNLKKSVSQRIHGNDLYALQRWEPGQDTLSRFSTKGTGIASIPLHIATWDYLTVVGQVHDNQIYTGRKLSFGDMVYHHSASYSTITGAKNTGWYPHFNFFNFSYTQSSSIHATLISGNKILFGGNNTFGWTSLPKSDINVNGNNQAISNGAVATAESNHTDFGVVSLGLPAERTYTIRNEGLVLLSVQNIMASSPDFTISDIVLPAHLQSGASISFKVNGTSSTKGIKTANIQINNSDTDKSIYTFAIKANVQDAEIDVLGNSISIPNGSTALNINNNTDFGASALNIANIKNFTIKNTGIGTLKINNISSSSVNFTTGNTSFPLLIPAGGTFNFSITQLSNTAGIKTATIGIASTDEDEATYTFEVRTNVLESEINIFGNGLSIENGFSTPNLNNHTDFGTCTLGESIIRTFSIKNEGLGKLQINNLQFNNTAFTPNSTVLPVLIEAGQTWNFEVMFFSNLPATHEALLSISSNDIDESNYVFAVKAKVVAPSINLSSNSATINAGSTQISALNNTDFGTNFYASTVAKNFTIQNNSLGKLEIYSISQTNADNFNIQPIELPMTLEANQSFTFAITLKTNVVGKKVSTIFINTNDPQTDIFSFDIGAEVTKSPQIITFGAIPQKSYHDASFVLNATSDANLPISYQSSNLSVATISGNTLTIVGVGNANITALQNGNENYLMATNVVQNLVVTKASQTITFPTIPDKVFGSSSFELNATTSSSLAPSYNITTNPATGVATLSGNTITITGLGSVSVTATQAGNTNYEPATDVVRTFNIMYPTNTQPNIALLEIIVYPNPSKSGIYEVAGIQSLDKQQVTYSVFDASGKTIQHGIWVGKDREKLDLQKVASGSYTIVLQGSKGNITKKIAKE